MCIRDSVKAAPLYVTMEHLENGVARAIVANAGNANACAPDGMENARRMAKVAAKVLGVDEDDVVVASTGVIGQRPVSYTHLDVYKRQIRARCAPARRG